MKQRINNVLLSKPDTKLNNKFIHPPWVYTPNVELRGAALLRRPA